MTDLRELYQEIIIDHSKKPRNFRRITDPESKKAEGYNPLCGDKITVYLMINNGKIDDLSFEGSGCAISTASASLMTEILKGKNIADARLIFDQFHKLVTGKEPIEATPQAVFNKLSVLGGVKEFPMRVKCATLAWHALKNAIDQKLEVASTE